MYYVRSKARALQMRDQASGEMKPITPRAWVAFEAVPAHLAEPGDGDVELRAPQGPEDVAAIEADNGRMAAEDRIVAENRAKRVADHEKAAEPAKVEEAKVEEAKVEEAKAKGKDKAKAKGKGK